MSLRAHDGGGMNSSAPREILLMAHGAAESLEELPSYYAHVRGTPPPPALLEELALRYRAIGGRSPLSAITRSLAGRLQEEVDRRYGPQQVRVRFGFKHTKPFVQDVVEEIVSAGSSDLLGIALAPHYSRFAIEGYRKVVATALADATGAPRFRMVPNWHTEPSFVALRAEQLRDALARLPEGVRSNARVCFTAHSLPESRIVEGDPYIEQLRQGASAIAREAHLPPIGLLQAWQSAGRTDEHWLGPDLGEVLRAERERGARAIVVCPHGFVCDHLEILYDIDLEARGVAESVGLRLERSAMPNDDPRFAAALADVAARNACAPGA